MKSNPPPTKEVLSEIHTTGKDDEKAPLGTVDKLLLEVTVEGQKEWVTIKIDNGVFRISTTATEQNGAYVQSALTFLEKKFPVFSTTQVNHVSKTTNSTPSIEGQSIEIQPVTNLSNPLSSQPSDINDHEGRRSVPPGPISTFPPPMEQKSSFLEETSQALKDVILAIVRSGAEQAQEAPPVQAAIDRFTESCPQPIPIGISRWSGRLQQAFVQKDHPTLIQLLHAAIAFTQALDTKEKSNDQIKIITTWLGTQSSTEGNWTIWERTLLEIARERLDGLTRASIERRYLIDTMSGVMYVEERGCHSENQTPISVGPCPRVIQVGLAEVAPSPFPRKIRLLQYSVSAEPTLAHWNHIKNQTTSNFNQLETLYFQCIKTYSNLCEPFVLIHPKAFKTKPSPHLLDEKQNCIPIEIKNQSALTRLFKQIEKTHALHWITGRLFNHPGTLMLAPTSLMVFDGKRSKFIRIP